MYRVLVRGGKYRPAARRGWQFAVPERETDAAPMAAVPAVPGRVPLGLWGALLAIGALVARRFGRLGLGS